MTTLLRRFAQGIRHQPMLKRFDGLWNALRPTYRWMLNRTSPHGVGVTINGEVVRIDPAFASIGWETVEPECYRTFIDAVPPDGLVFDIGSHIGTYSILCARKLASNGRVVAFEPTNVTREYLVKHLAWNGVTDRVTVRASCCSDKPGTAKFYVKIGDAEAQNSLRPDERFDVVEVEATTIDAEAAKVGRTPDLIKIDVEGGEWDVLQGAEATLTKRRPLILLSVHPDRLPESVTEESILERLHGLGYKTRILGRDHEVHVWAESQ